MTFQHCYKYLLHTSYQPKISRGLNTKDEAAMKVLRNYLNIKTKLVPKKDSKCTQY
jgi:hypothetical protein